VVDGVLEVGFASPVSPGLPVEVASRADIVERMGPDHSDAPAELDSRAQGLALDANTAIAALC